MKVSIRLALISVILGLIWATFIVTTSSTYLSSQRSLREHAHDIMQNIAKLAMQEAYTHLNHAQGAAILTKRLLTDDIVGSSQSTVNVLEQYFYNNMAINPHFAGIYLGLPNGSFFDVRRYDGRRKNGFRTKILIKSSDGRTNQTHLIYRDENFAIMMEEDDLEDNYDPRKRPWYIKAVKERKIVWTDPYIFYSSGKPGITIAGPSFDRQGHIKGVIGVDIEIDQLSTFIASLKIGKNGSAFMLNRNGEVVAHPDLDALRSQDHPDKSHHRLVKIDELKDDASRIAYGSLLSSTTSTNLSDLRQARLSNFVFEGKDYTSMIVPFTRWEWPWFICVFLPEDDFLGDLKANRRLNMGITFVISLMATALGLFIARSIIRPISDLEAEATAIKNDDFDFDTRISSSYTEIRASVESFRMMKHAVQASQRRYRGIFQNIQDVYFEATMDGEILEISPSIEKVYGINRQGLIGRSLVNYLVESAEFDHLKDGLRKSKRCLDFQVKLKSKGRRIAYGSINAELVTDTQKRPLKLIGSLRDITKRREAEKELEKYRQHLEDQIEYRTRDLEEVNSELHLTEERFRELFKNTSDLIHSVDTHCNLLMVNKAWLKTLKYDREEIIGKNLFQLVYRDKHPECRTLFQNAFRGEPQDPIETTFIAKDGALVHVIGNVTPRAVDGEIVAVQAIFHDITERKKNEKAILEAHSKLEQRVEERTAALTEANTRLRIEMNESKQAKERLSEAYAELQSAQEQLIQAAKLASIGELASGVAHELNQPLMVIRGNAQMLKKAFRNNASPLKETGECIHYIERNTKRMMNIIKHLRSFSRQSQLKFAPVDINAVLTDALLMLEEQLRLHNVTLNKQLGSNLPLITGDANQLEQTFLNLLTNARDAIEIKRAQFPNGEEDGVNHRHSITVQTQRSFENETILEILIHDSGCGILPEHVPNVFDPFFTTKQVGQGTGLGLSISYGIVRDHGGSIEILENGKEGTTMRVSLPIVSLAAKRHSK
jgi:two-component system cell cycle sensor histidine kinase/response regulator CckA